MRLQVRHAVVLPRDAGVNRAFALCPRFFRFPVPLDVLFNPVFVGVSGEVRHPVGVGTEKEDHGVDVSGDTSDRAHINKRAGILVQLPPRAVPVVERLSPGEIVVVNDHGYKIVQYTNQTQLAICSMEFIYFARPDSDIYGVNVHSARKRMGARLAQESPVDADMVIGVPNSSLSAASGYAEEAGLPNEMGLIKNQYVARTCIQPTQELREQGVRMKLSAVRGVVKGKRVIVIDDSIVRGTTSKRIVQLLKEAGAAEVHMRISSPPLKYPCFYGIDISTTKELIAAKKSVEEIRDFIGADSLAFLSLDGLVESIGLGADAPYGGLCVAYFNGDYPTALDDYESDFLKSLTPEDRVRLPEFALYKSKYEGNEYTTTSSQEEH